MSFAGARARLKKLEKANPPTHRFDWRVFTGEVEPDLDSEPWPGHGMTWRQIINEPPPDPLAAALSRLPQKPVPAIEAIALPDSLADTIPAQPSSTETRYEPAYPPGYVPADEPEPEADTFAPENDDAR